uniref:C2H2-type domain-containing protein n=1 Tax=Physcomitrium patens TaxID=3218 RepID=A0A7I4EPK2_PHYPA
MASEPVTKAGGASSGGNTEIPRIRCPACFKQFSTDENLVRHLEKACHTEHEPQCGVCHKHCFCFEALREHLLGRLAKKECAAEFSRRGCSLCLDVLESEEALTNHRLKCQFMSACPSGKVLTTPMEQSIKGAIDAPEGSAEAAHFSEERQYGAVALDCEMVGGGSDGSINICARVCLVDEDENVLLNTYVQPLLPVTDYRDTATYQLFVKTSGVSHKLRFLTEVFLGYKIQDGTIHDPCEDAIAAMRLYKRMRSRRHAGALVHVCDLSQLSLQHVDAPQWSYSSVYSYSEPSFYCWCVDSKT